MTTNYRPPGHPKSRQIIERENKKTQPQKGGRIDKLLGEKKKRLCSYCNTNKKIGHGRYNACSA